MSGINVNNPDQSLAAVAREATRSLLLPFAHTKIPEHECGTILIAIGDPGGPPPERITVEMTRDGVRVSEMEVIHEGYPWVVVLASPEEWEAFTRIHNPCTTGLRVRGHETLLHVLARLTSGCSLLDFRALLAK